MNEVFDLTTDKEANSVYIITLHSEKKDVISVLDFNNWSLAGAIITT